MKLSSAKKIAIIGVGFMGGSLGLSLKKVLPKIRVCGYARSQRSYTKLKKLKLLDAVEKNMAKIVEGADIVILALPVQAINDYFRRIAPFLKKGAIVFDLGSSKKSIEESAHRFLPKNVSFVGCHPLCGSEKSGAEFSRSDLYEGACCIITSSKSKQSTRIVAEVFRRLGSKVTFVSPDRHDKILSCVSHLPHLVSFSLTGAVSDKYFEFASGSFRDLTRISASPASVWGDIFLSNKRNIIKDLHKFIKVLKTYEGLIRANNKAGLKKAIDRVNIKQKRVT